MGVAGEKILLDFVCFGAGESFSMKVFYFHAVRNHLVESVGIFSSLRELVKQKSSISKCATLISKFWRKSIKTREISKKNHAATHLSFENICVIKQEKK